MKNKTSDALLKVYIAIGIVAIAFGLYLILFSNIDHSRKLIYSLVIGVVLVMDVIFPLQARKLDKELQKYVDRYQLSPQKLAELTGFSRYDFSLGTKGEMLVMNGTMNKRRQVIAKLQAQYGKL